jgi:hypothetical protein
MSLGIANLTGQTFVLTAIRYSHAAAVPSGGLRRFGSSDAVAVLKINRSI